MQPSAHTFPRQEYPSKRERKVERRKTRFSTILTSFILKIVSYFLLFFAFVLFRFYFLALWVICADCSADDGLNPICTVPESVKKQKLSISLVVDFGIFLISRKRILFLPTLVDFLNPFMSSGSRRMQKLTTNG